MLAAGGEISAADWQLLSAHLEECEACRGVFAAGGEIHGQWLPQRGNFPIVRDPNTESLLKRRVLKQISRNGGRLSKAALDTSSKHAGFFWFPKIAIPAFSFAAGVFFFIGVTHVARSGNFHPQDKQSRKLPAASAAAGNEKPRAPEVTVPPDSLNSSNSATKIAALQTALETQLGATQAHEKELLLQLQDAHTKADNLQLDDAAAKQQVADLQQQLQSVRLAEGKTEAELVSLKESQTTKDVVISAQDQEIRQLHDNLDTQSASLQREGELMSAGREIRDLIAARNLHIVDVYDTDETGRTRKSFGRVFYTEGKSLVFYAYDLPTHGAASAKYAYYAWGKRDGSTSEAVRKLGILYNDDKAQQRWVLTVSDPNVLAAIDSVFVTLEHTDYSGDGPHGKKVLSTNLIGPPNHP